ncbi:DMT family transporter [Celeribacter sp.]|uniref:DMT family transporter n=1 Tax=Celeribacter sp. TaxID=1890673 RepID=UPI003A8FB3EE
MAWISLLIAGLLEVAWAAGLKSLSGSFRLGVLVATAALMCASLGALSWSMRSLPLGIAYPIWTGIGSVGSVVVGIIVFRQDLTATSVAGVACLVAGMALISLETH